MEEINRHLEIVKSNNISVIVGVGGGKTLDTAKAIAYLNKKPVIICPTLASTDAPTSALAIIYKPTGEFESYMHLPFNPNIVLVDTKMIINAPARFLASGIGDALATYYEAKICVEADSQNMAGGLSTRAAFALATLCKDTLYKYGIQAVKDCKDKNASIAFEAIVEANTLLSGLGFESSGLAAAHSIHDGLTELEETHHFLHGEKVAFGTVTQAVIDNELKELERIVKFCVGVGLPVTLKDLGIVNDIEKKVQIVAEKTVDKDETIHSYPYKMTSKIVYDAIIKADKLATKIKENL
jgi:glycerol dehydrogenase